MRNFKTCIYGYLVRRRWRLTHRTNLTLWFGTLSRMSCQRVPVGTVQPERE